MGNWAWVGWVIGAIALVCGALALRVAIRKLKLAEAKSADDKLKENLDLRGEVSKLNVANAKQETLLEVSKQISAVEKEISAVGNGISAVEKKVEIGRAETELRLDELNALVRGTQAEVSAVKKTCLQLSTQAEVSAVKKTCLQLMIHHDRTANVLMSVCQKLDMAPPASGVPFPGEPFSGEIVDVDLGGEPVEPPTGSAPAADS